MDELLVCDFEFLLLNCFSHLLLFYFVIGCACFVNVTVTFGHTMCPLARKTDSGIGGVRF